VTPSPLPATVAGSVEAVGADPLAEQEAVGGGAGPWVEREGRRRGAARADPLGSRGRRPTAAAQVLAAAVELPAPKLLASAR